MKRQDVSSSGRSRAEPEERAHPEQKQIPPARGGLGMTMEPSLLTFGRLGGVLAGPVDGIAAEAETEIAGVASAATIRTDKEQFVENLLLEASSSGAVNGGAAAFGTVGGHTKGKHGTVLFLAWNPKLYTTNRGKALSGLRASRGYKRA